MTDRPRPVADPALRSDLRDIIESALGGTAAGRRPSVDSRPEHGLVRSPGSEAARLVRSPGSEAAGLVASWAGGYGGTDRISITKDTVSRWLAGSNGRGDEVVATAEPSIPLAIGAMVDVLFRQLIVTGDFGDPWDDAIEALDLDAHGALLARWVRALPPATRNEIAAEVERQIGGLQARWPVLSPAWLPRTQESYRVPLLDGRVELAARVDLAVGAPCPARSSVGIVEIKTGARHPDHRLDARFYALAAALRDPAPPFMVATYYTRTGEIDVDPVTRGVLLGAARRVAAAITSARTRVEPAPNPSLFTGNRMSIAMRGPSQVERITGAGPRARECQEPSAGARSREGTVRIRPGLQPSAPTCSAQGTGDNGGAAQQVSSLSAGRNRIVSASLRERLDAAAGMARVLLPGDRAAVVDAWFLDHAHTDPGRLLEPAEPFQWSPRSARRSLGMAIAGAYIAGGVTTPSAAASAIADEAVGRWSSTGERTFGWEPWYSRLGRGGRAAALADALTWAISVSTAVDWRRCAEVDFSTTRERARLGAAPGILLAGRFDATVHTASGQVAVIVINGTPRGDVESKLLLPVLARSLRPGSQVLPSRVAGIWPDARMVASVRVGDGALARTASAVESAIFTVFGSGAALTA